MDAAAAHAALLDALESRAIPTIRAAMAGYADTVQGVQLQSSAFELLARVNLAQEKELDTLISEMRAKVRAPAVAAATVDAEDSEAPPAAESTLEATPTAQVAPAAVAEPAADSPASAKPSVKPLLLPRRAPISSDTAQLTPGSRWLRSEQQRCSHQRGQQTTQTGAAGSRAKPLPSDKLRRSQPAGQPRVSWPCAPCSPLAAASAQAVSPGSQWLEEQAKQAAAQRPRR